MSTFSLKILRIRVVLLDELPKEFSILSGKRYAREINHIMM